jgi:hypothetical protein
LTSVPDPNASLGLDTELVIASNLPDFVPVKHETVRPCAPPG